ncbi:MAG: SUMF1/EgtB/PvdO family nonheme iron enzyme [Dinghuibacter sp.]|nr:SUMF1/EgtB/PvdO family nonheme iron enzyme [Dinghuibacter sp.]
MKQLKKWVALLLFWVPLYTQANNIQISNVTTVITGSVVQVQFDLSWENSWRASSTGNWDGAWVFFKFRDNDGRWKQLPLTGNNMNIPVGFSHTIPANNSNPGVGMFIYRSANGFGNVALTGIRAGISSFPGTYNIKGFAVEMVYIPQGSYFLGDAAGSNASNGYYRGTNTLLNYQVTGAGSTVILGTATTHLRDNIATTATDTLDNFPVGYNAYWMMKYELSQDGYVQFLNCLTYLQQVYRGGTPNVAGSHVLVFHTGGRIRVQTAGVSPATPAVYGNDADGDNIFNETNDGQWNTMGGLSWADVAAWLDWAGLRPTTEMEYEKSARGPLTPVNDEFPWGNATIASTPYTVTNNYQANSTINYSSTEGNAVYSLTEDTSTVRNGIFANSLSTRVSAGAGYYGAMELAGNTMELCVTTANIAGRSYTGWHGDGALTDSGQANENFWPGINGNNSTTTPNTVFGGVTGVNNDAGIIKRGGAYHDVLLNFLRTSYRLPHSLYSGTGSRLQGHGVRGVRDAN